MKRHYYERNIIEIKNEYTQFLINIMVSPLYEGIKCLYRHALNTEDKLKESMKNNSSFTNPGIVKIFQMYLKDIESLNINEIEKETIRIKNNSKCSDWFDDLVKAVVKSNIVLLTYNVSDKTCKLVEDKYHERINIADFVHKCYIECARVFYNNPEFIWHEHTRNTHLCDIRKNKTEINDMIKNAILEAIRKMLPIKLVLSEYLSNDYINDNYVAPPIEKFNQIRDLVKDDINNKHVIEHRVPIVQQNIEDVVNNIKNSTDSNRYINHVQKNSSKERSMSICSPKLQNNNIMTDNELDIINNELSKLKDNVNSDTSDFTLNNKIKASDSLLNIAVERQKLI